MSTPAEKPPRAKVTSRAKSLTVAQKAEAAALWRGGMVTLDDLAKTYKKSPEMFSRLFTRMGIKKGSGVAAAMRKAEEAIAVKALSDTEVTLSRIAKAKDDHFRMSQKLAYMAFADIQQARAAEIEMGKLKETMSVYKMAMEVIGTARKEIFAVLNVEKYDMDSDLDDLPELMVRELSQGDILQLQSSPIEELDGSDMGDSMLDLEDDE